MKKTTQPKTKLVQKWDTQLGKLTDELVEVPAECPTLKERWRQQQEEGTWMAFEGL